MGEEMIITEQAGDGICIVRLNRPERLNALSRDMVNAFNERLDAIADDDAIRVVILTGSGHVFCAGQDVKAADDRNRHAPSGVVERMIWQERFAGMPTRLRAMPQIVIAALNGPCVGAGMALALAADIRIATPEVRFLNAAVKLGLTAGESGMSYMLPRLIGASRAFEILLTGRPISAEEAERIGLVARLVDTADLLPEAMAYAAQILANSPFGTAYTKRLLWDNLDAASFHAARELENRTQILASMTHDYSEATAAFADKRPPIFKGV